MPITITREAPDSDDGRALVDELDAQLIPMYPIENHHGLNVEQLIADEVAFFILRVDGAAAGCGGIKLFGDAYGEIKRMYVRPAYRGRGLSKLMLEHLVAHAREQGLPTLRLETGYLQSEAIRLYEHMGFVPTGPFGAYTADPVSLFYEKDIRPGAQAG